jgi:large subunit ribosomal protein L25
MEKTVLKAERRSMMGKKASVLRREGKLPAVIYGHNLDSMPIVLDMREANHILGGMTSSSLVTIELEGKEYPALVRERQRDYIKGEYLHIDFQGISMTEKIRANVPVEIVGTSQAVKLLTGVLVTNMHELEVESLPQYLPENISIDISNLNEIGDSFLVSDLELGENIEILADPEEVIVTITALTPEEVEEEEAVEEVTLEEPEVIERARKEEEESEE